MDLAVVWSTLEYFLEVRKLVRVDRSKVCLGSIMDLLVLIYSNSQLKICKNYVLPLCEQLRIFIAYGYVQSKNNQNENCISEENNLYKFGKIKCTFH